jgi:hypothetical protein
MVGVSNALGAAFPKDIADIIAAYYYRSASDRRIDLVYFHNYISHSGTLAKLAHYAQLDFNPCKNISDNSVFLKYAKDIPIDGDEYYPYFVRLFRRIWRIIYLSYKKYYKEPIWIPMSFTDLTLNWLCCKLRCTFKNGKYYYMEKDKTVRFKHMFRSFNFIYDVMDRIVSMN